MKDLVMPVLPITVTNHRGKTYTIKQAPTTGGKVARQNNKNSSLTVTLDGEMVKRFPYRMSSHESKYGAISRALTFCLGKLEATNFLSRHTASQ